MQNPRLFLKIYLQEIFPALKFALLADESVCGRENSSSRGSGRGLVEIIEKFVHLLVFYDNKSTF